jgi:hypothetical protein
MRHIAILTLAATLVANPAQARPGTETDTSVAAAIACASIADGEQRLHCYDQAIAGLTRAVEAGDLLGQKTVAEQPQGLEGVIKASGGRGYDLFWVSLDNGDRWEVTARNSDDLPRPGRKVKLTRSPLGFYFFHEPGYPARRARFLGRS